MKKRENEYSSEISSFKQEHDSTVRDTQSRYESQIQSLTERLEASNEKAMELERALSVAEGKLEKKKFRWGEKSAGFENKIKELVSNHNTVKSALDDREN
jgi:chromosome segregation ATPase